MRLASRGLRDLGDGLQRIEDLDELAVVRAQARRVLMKSAVATAAVVIVLVLLW